MQFLNLLQISMVLLVQGAAAFTNTLSNFGCKDRVANHPEAGCAASTPGSSTVGMMVAAWNNNIHAYDCSQVDPRFRRGTCCSDPSNLDYQISVDLWKQDCREIDGSEIKP
ncbi:hypothetical protein PSHT_10015 [Puccinia striiformis]|uniref:Secreted protein n=1 Tax=Puccinia striiformis TaxID=27350 RepID=A0A2S4VCT5_9BASI|nr:hypothetical protein Pst134EB_016956 [Puccinia striiformis f. sp. tritici]KAI9602433.1 hypothetical protein H4Q26_001722 [Puccinia striiformis f. sp. tritici PST-130]KAI9605605.1 hypothetical protein KEM48_002059 [Puccinia striiformis f. sp. tritici PST-130]POW07240.1 hypothetical protein PSHT_10015 [Puccinia striiformis]